MVRHAIVTLVAAILVVAGGCSRLALDAKAEEAKLLKRDAEWAAAAAGKDVEKIISYWSDDALVMPPGQPALEGKAALRSFVTDSLKIPGFQIRWKSDKVSFSPDGKLAYMRGTNETTVRGPTGRRRRCTAVPSPSGVGTPMGNGGVLLTSGTQHLPLR